MEQQQAEQICNRFTSYSFLHFTSFALFLGCVFEKYAWRVVKVNYGGHLKGHGHIMRHQLNERKSHPTSAPGPCISSDCCSFTTSAKYCEKELFSGSMKNITQHKLSPILPQ